MFIEVRKNSQVFIQHNDIGADYVAQVTSNFRINLRQVAELSTYSIKEQKVRQGLDGYEVNIPVNTRILHLEMSYNHSTTTKPVEGGTQGVMKRYYYKIYFLPPAHDEFARLKKLIDEQTLA